MVFSFQLKTKEVVIFRHGLDIEANSYDEALQLLKTYEEDGEDNWQFERQVDTVSVLQRDMYYIGIRENGSLIPKPILILQEIFDEEE